MPFSSIGIEPFSFEEKGATADSPDRFGLCEIPSGMKECPYQRMRFGFARRGLGQKQHGRVKRMTVKLDGPDIAVVVRSRHLQFASEQPVPERGVETEVALEPFVRGILTIRVRYDRSGNETDGLLTADQRARKAVDQQRGGIGIGLFECGFLEACGVSRILHQSMLESASGADKGP